MSMVATLTEAAVEQFVIDWFRKLDVHAPVGDLLPRLAPDGLEMRLPEITLRSQADFIKWYEGVTRKFFDETHTMQALKVQVSPKQADIQLSVNWQAHTWQPPEPRSRWIGFDVAQRWTVQLSPLAQQLVIVTYIVDALTPMPGSPEL